jgi:RimJ/RimL family protein N-acetyltransferase
MSTAWFDRPALSGRYVRLEPLSTEHAPGLFEAGKDPGVWTWLSKAQPQDVADMRLVVTQMLAAYEARDQVPWVQIDARTGEVAGTTSYHDLEPQHRGLYIGHTWIGPRWQRTGLNTESKLMLLERAFDVLGAVRVGWMTHHNNQRSQRAIERLGAQRDGILRNHRIMPDGGLRNTVVYSVIQEEWPTVRDSLRDRLTQSGGV